MAVKKKRTKVVKKVLVKRKAVRKLVRRKEEFATRWEERRLWESVVANVSLRLDAEKAILQADKVLSAYRARFAEDNSIVDCHFDD